MGITKTKGWIEPQKVHWVILWLLLHMCKIGGYTTEPVLLFSENSSHETKEPP
jgi:hypothetical protein